MRLFRKGDRVKCVSLNGILSSHRFTIGEIYIVDETYRDNPCGFIINEGATLEERIATINNTYANHAQVFPCFRLVHNKKEHLPEWF